MARIDSIKNGQPFALELHGVKHVIFAHQTFESDIWASYVKVELNNGQDIHVPGHVEVEVI